MIPSLFCCQQDRDAAMAHRRTGHRTALCDSNDILSCVRNPPNLNTKEFCRGRDFAANAEGLVLCTWRFLCGSVQARTASSGHTCSLGPCALGLRTIPCNSVLRTFASHANEPECRIPVFALWSKFVGRRCANQLPPRWTYPRFGTSSTGISRQNRTCDRRLQTWPRSYLPSLGTCSMPFDGYGVDVRATDL